MNIFLNACIHSLSFDVHIKRKKNILQIYWRAKKILYNYYNIILTFQLYASNNFCFSVKKIKFIA